VHADDVAGVIMAAIENWYAATGESFNAVSGSALTLRRFAEGMVEWFGRRSDLAFEPFATWGGTQSEADRTATWEHISRSPNFSMEKARRLLGFVPKYGSLEAVQEAVTAMIAKGEVTG
jgi:nucleoside-diphosphate-sugar epimerase